MKLSIKMMFVFSAIMILSLFSFSSYTAQNSIVGSNKYTEARYVNMSANISTALKQEISMMHMTVNELSNNLSFTSTLNQFVRDDSTDQKMMTAARQSVLQSLYQSPMVDQFYRVSFIGLDGRYITTQTEKDFDYTVPTEVFAQLLAPSTNSTASSEGLSYQVIAPHKDLFSTRSDILVYGIIEPIKYYGNILGYISVLNECSSLNYLTEFIDNTYEVEVQISFDDGVILFSTSETPYAFTTDMETDTMCTWTEESTGAVREVLYTKLSSLGLNLYMSQNQQISRNGAELLRISVIKRTLVIMAIALTLIGVLSFELTRSIRLLTKRVQQMSSKDILANTTSQSLTEMVTTPQDHEIYSLELAYNEMLERLRNSTINELSLRESTLHAQLNALQTQINPHFIYNTLNIISAKSMESGNFDIIEICDQFASMLRYSTDTHSRTATLQEEIENVENYLLLAKARYEENLEFFIDVPDDLQNIYVPKLTLQPLVENALTHGFNGKNILRKLSVIEKIENQNLILEIRDNGTGFSEETLKDLQTRIAEIEAGRSSLEESNQHIGLINTCLRLYYYSKGNIRISIKNDYGAVITVNIPQNPTFHEKRQKQLFQNRSGSDFYAYERGSYAERTVKTGI